jgi:hypothetical protein
VNETVPQTTGRGPRRSVDRGSDEALSVEPFQAAPFLERGTRPDGARRPLAPRRAAWLSSKKRFEGVVLDAGWGKGEVAFRKYPDEESTFMDRGGRVCRAPNREIFSYEDPRHPTLAHGSDPELARFLTARCGPEFDVTPLAAGPRHLRARTAERRAAAPAAAPRPIRPG